MPIPVAVLPPSKARLRRNRLLGCDLGSDGGRQRFWPFPARIPSISTPAILPTCSPPPATVVNPVNVTVLARAKIARNRPAKSLHGRQCIHRKQQGNSECDNYTGAHRRPIVTRH